MAAPSKARGFTLVELLVVITIIGMLVSLLLPAIQAAREAGRRTTCLNNMRNVGSALTQVETSNRGFPGYANALPGRTITLPTGQTTVPKIIGSWVVPILPALEQMPLYQNWMNPQLNINWDPSSPANNRAQFITELNILRCPSNANPELNDDALSFAVNTGSALVADDNYTQHYTANPNWREDPASGVMFNQSRIDYPSESIKKVNMDYISANDGSTNTLLVSENLQTAGWATGAEHPESLFLMDYEVRQATGLVWFLTGNHENINVENPSSSMTGHYLPLTAGINDAAQSVSGTLKQAFDSGNLSEPTGLAYARPSSYHPGGVNSMFCGSNARFLNDSIDYKVYTQMMTPRQTQVIVDYDGTTPIRANFRPTGATVQVPLSSGGMYGVKVPWGYILDEADL